MRVCTWVGVHHLARMITVVMITVFGRRWVRVCVFCVCVCVDLAHMTTVALCLRQATTSSARRWPNGSPPGSSSRGDGARPAPFRMALAAAALSPRSTPNDYLDSSIRRNE